MLSGALPPWVERYEPGPARSRSLFLCGAVDVRARSGVRVEAGRIDRFPRLLVDAVRPVVDPLQRRLQLGELVLELLEDAEILLVLERLGSAVGRVLVVV